VEKGIGNGTTDTLMKEKKEERHLHSFFCEAIAIVWEVPLNQAVSFHLA
jgi:hypothetical protein